MEHLTQEQLDALVMGLVSRDDEPVRRHLATCVECARRVAREARLESELYETAATVPEDVAVERARRAPGRAWRVALPAAAALAVVAYGTAIEEKGMSDTDKSAGFMAEFGRQASQHTWLSLDVFTCFV